MVGGVTSTIRSNVVSGNHGSRVGGILVFGPWSLVESNAVVSNTSNNGVGGVWAGEEGYIRLVANRIAENSGSLSGGILATEVALHLTHNDIFSNTGESGGAIAAGGSYRLPVSVTMDSNEIFANHATQNGGGVYFWPDTVFTLTNNVIADNSAVEMGGGIYISDSQGTLINNTIAENEEGAGEGICLAGSSAVTLANNIIVSHTYGIYNDGTGSPTVTYNDVWGNSVGDYWGVTPGTGNISADPGFVDPGGWDFHLMPGSPAINAGHPDDSIAPAFDFDGDVRPAGTRVDMGADEVSPEFSIAKVAQPAVVSPGGLLTYTIAVTNLTESAINGVVITDRVPASTTFGWADDGGELVGDEVVWTGLSIEAGGGVEVSWGVTVTGRPVVEEIINGSYGVKRLEEQQAVTGEAVHTPVATYRWWYPLAMKDGVQQ